MCDLLHMLYWDFKTFLFVSGTARKIAFSVDFNGFSQRLNNINQILVYKNILINHGSGYNTNTGRFTTPEAGTYAFFSSV